MLYFGGCVYHNMCWGNYTKHAVTVVNIDFMKLCKNNITLYQQDILKETLQFTLGNGTITRQFHVQKTVIYKNPTVFT